MNEVRAILQNLLADLNTTALLLLATIIVVVIASALVVPIAVLFWWARWVQPRPTNPPPIPADGNVAHDGPFLVYLAGIGDVTGDYLNRYEDDFLRALAATSPELNVVSDVFAYSVDNAGLLNERALGWFWRWVNHARAGQRRWFRRVEQLIWARNALYVLVSADRRYGPVYNYSVAALIVAGLRRRGYQRGSGAPITLLGYSGGGQLSLAAAGHVRATLHAPVQVISLAGVLNESPSLDSIERLYHLYGTRDSMQRFGIVIFPMRWPWARRSRWNRALAAGTIVPICLGSMSHTGIGSYMDPNVINANGVSYQAYTVATIAQLVRDFSPKAESTSFKS